MTSLTFCFVFQFQLGGLTVSKQLIGVANRTSGFSGVDGLVPHGSHFLDLLLRIFGVGPVGLTRKTVSNMKLVPTVLDNLYKSKGIWYEALGVYFKPLTGNVSPLFIPIECCPPLNGKIDQATAQTNGEITLGGEPAEAFHRYYMNYNTCRKAMILPSILERSHTHPSPKYPLTISTGVSTSVVSPMVPNHC
jgi:hypothetical protein